MYTAHRTESVKALNINLYYIPPGCTDLLHPLDIRVFGALKAKAWALFRNRYQSVPSPRVTLKEAVQNLLQAWKELDQQVTEEAWFLYDVNPE